MPKPKLLDVKPAHPCHRDQLVRLRRAEGQVRGVASMIEEGKYCVDVITQLRAARAALASVEAKILSKHIGSCIRDAFESRSEDLINERIEEIVDFAVRATK